MTPSRTQQLKGAALALAGVALMAGVTSLLRSDAGWSLDLPVNPIAAAFGALMLAYYAVGVGLRAHHLLIWDSLLVAGLLPVWDGEDPSNVGLVLSGAALMVNGVFDHLLLARAFSPAAPTLDAGNAGG